MKIVKFKVFRFGKKVGEGSFLEIKEVPREKIEQTNILISHYSTIKNEDIRNKFLQLLVFDGVNKHVEEIKNYFDYKTIFDDDDDFEKDELEGKKTDEDFLKEKLKDLIDKIF